MLAISFVLECVSWFQARAQLNADAARVGRRMRDQLWETTDPAATTVFFEDTAALAGLVLAGAGVALHEATGSTTWDGLASVAIGLLLVVVALALGRENRSLIVGEAADPRITEGVRELLAAHPEVDAVDEVLTMVIGRAEVLVAARIDLDDDITAGEVEALARRMESEIVAAHPFVRHFFLDVTADSGNPRP